MRADPSLAPNAATASRRPRKRFRKTVIIGSALAGAAALAFEIQPGSGEEPAVRSAAARTASIEGGTAGTDQASPPATARINEAMLDPVPPRATPRRDERGTVAMSVPAAGRQGQFEIGDTLKIVFYERVNDAEADKWGRDRSSLQGFQQRPELSGDYSVEGDGTMTLPLLGAFPAINQTSKDLQSALATSFEKLTGRSALVTIVSVQRPPIYVLGPVKKPGPYAYMPGMTLLHAVALAGGYGNADLQPWQQLEAVREVERGRSSVEALPKQIARAAVLKAERDGSPPTPPADLIRMVGAAKAKLLVDQEVARRNPIAAARQVQQNALAASLQAAKQDIQRLAGRQQPIDQLIEMRRQRAAAMQGLADKRMVSSLVLIQAQSELTDAEQRRQEAANQLASAQQRVNDVEQQRARFEAETKSTLETEIAAAEQQISNDGQEAATSRGVLGVLHAVNVGYVSGGDDNRSRYEIVRQTATGPISIAANGLTTLQPGDLVRISEPGGRAGGEAQPDNSRPAAAPGSGQAGAIIPIDQPGER